jgi:hypothetical protein
VCCSLLYEYFSILPGLSRFNNDSRTSFAAKARMIGPVRRDDRSNWNIRQSDHNRFCVWVIAILAARRYWICTQPSDTESSPGSNSGSPPCSLKQTTRRCWRLAGDTGAEHIAGLSSQQLERIAVEGEDYFEREVRSTLGVGPLTRARYPPPSTLAPIRTKPTRNRHEGRSARGGQLSLMRAKETLRMAIDPIPL